MTDRIYSVSQLNQAARLLLEGHFPLIWVSGELSNLARPSSGHWYFSLKDAQAQVRCAMFRMRNRLLGFEPKEGMAVLVQARVSLYEGRGDYQLIVEHLEETGDGALRRAFEKLKAELQARGLFDPAHKKPLPTMPKRIGVITSPTGAALQDILTTLKRRFPAIPVTVYPCEVQGKTAGGNLAKAIACANDQATCDVLLLARGGGSLEDLWAFNEAVVAQTIFDSEIPIVSGVGHEIDFTIADFVADVRAATPTAAAELVVPDQQAWLADLLALQTRLSHRFHQTLVRLQQDVMHLSKRLQHPGQRLAQQVQRVDQLEQQLKLSLQYVMDRKTQRFKSLVQTLNAVSPLATLARGYSIATDEQDQVLTSAAQTKVGDKVKLKLAEGHLGCLIEEIF